jgi:hypothetical protein
MNVSCTDAIVAGAPALSRRCRTTRYTKPLDPLSPETEIDVTLTLGWTVCVGVVGLLSLHAVSSEANDTDAIRDCVDRRRARKPHIIREPTHSFGNSGATTHDGYMRLSQWDPHSDAENPIAGNGDPLAGLGRALCVRMAASC